MKGGQQSKGVVTLVNDIAKAFEKVSLSVVWHWATYFGFPQRASMALCGQGDV